MVLLWSYRITEKAILILRICLLGQIRIRALHFVSGVLLSPRKRYYVHRELGLAYDLVS